MVRQKSFRAFYTTLFVASFGLNWFWEIAQMFFYKVKPAEMWAHILLYCTLAAVIDALVTLVSYKLTTALIRNRGWKCNGGWKLYALMALFGAIWAIFFEIAAKEFGLWSYNEWMPLVPVIGVGLSPLLQLTLLMPAALFLTKWRHKQDKEKK
jgi:hypothetical protein